MLDVWGGGGGGWGCRTHRSPKPLGEENAREVLANMRRHEQIMRCVSLNLLLHVTRHTSHVTRHLTSLVSHRPRRSRRRVSMLHLMGEGGGG